jgi:hypothetical protein
VAEAVQFDVKARDQATPTLNAIGREVDTLADKLDKLGAKNPSPKVTLDAQQASTKLTDFSDKMKALNNKRIRLDVDVNGTTQVGDLRRELSYMTDRKVKIDVQTADSNQKLKTITDRLKLIKDASAKVEITGNAEEKLDAIIGRVAALKEMSPVRIQINVDSAGALTELKAIEKSLGKINGNTATASVKITSDFDSSLTAKVGKLTAELMRLPAAFAIAGAAAGSSAADIASLGQAIVEMLGVAALVPGSFAAYAATMGTIKIATDGMDDAFKHLLDGKLEKFAKDLEKLSDNGRAFALAAKDLLPQWQNLGSAVQDAAFANLNIELKELAGAQLPAMKSGMVGIATELNKAAVSVANFLESGQGVARVNSIFENTSLVIGNIAPAAVNVVAALLDISDVGVKMLPGLTDGFEGASLAFRNFIAQARDSGQLQQWIQTGIDRVKQLADVLGNVGGIAFGAFQAASAAGVDFLSLLQRGTQAVEDFVRSAEGQNTLKAFFEESKQTIDAIVPGLTAAKDALVGFVGGFNDTNGLARFAAGISDVAETVGPLVADLGELAGRTLGLLGDSLSTTATLFSPVIGGTQGMLDVLGGLAPAALAAWAAFAGAKFVAGYLLTASTALKTYAAAQSAAILNNATAAGSFGNMTRSLGASGLSGALSGLGKALPVLGIGIVAVTALWDEFSVKTDEVADSVVKGSRSIQQAIIEEQRQIEHGTAFWFSAAQQQAAYAQGADDVRAKIEEQLHALGGLDEAQARVTISQKNYNDAIAQFPAGDARIKTAYDVLQRDTKNLADLQGKAASETDKHKSAIERLADAANKAANTQLDYEDAVKKVRDAEKAAGEELAKSGAKSDEYQTKVRDVARAMLSQAEAARKVAEANGTAADGQAAYVGELLKLNDGSKAGREALVKIATGMTDAERAAYSAAASATNLNTEIVKLPNGKEITVVVAGDTSALPTVEQQIKTITEKQYVGEITFQGNATMANGTVLESVKFANDQTGIIKLDANGEPVTAVVNGQKYLIDHSTGVMTIQGEPKPGVDSLNGFIYTVNAATGVASIDANPTLGLAQLTSFIGKVDTAKGTATIDGDPTLANGATTQAIRFADGSYGTISINGNEDPVNGKITASIRYADGSTGTITLDAQDQKVKAAQQNAERTINAPVVFDPDTAAVDAARKRMAAELKIPVTFTTTGEVKGQAGKLGLARGGVVAPSGVQVFAGGGTFPRLTPMAVGKAAAVAPNTWRVLGDRSDVPESYIPWKRDRRSNQLLDITARALGRTLLPLAAGAIIAFAPGGIQSPTPTPAAASSSVAPVVDSKYAEALQAAADAGTALTDVQQLVVDTATALADQTALTTEQVTALTDAATNATTVEQAYQVGLQAVQLANDAVTAAAQTRTAAEQIATDTAATALGQANAYTSGLTTLGAQAGGATTGGINTLTGAVSTETGTEATAQGQAQAYTGGLAALGGQASGATTGGITALTGAVNASGGATVTATGQAQAYTGQLTTLGGQAGGATAAGLQQAATAAQAQGAASAAAGGQAQAQAGQLQALGTSAGGAATQLQGVATAINNLPDGDFTVTANGRMGAITGTPTVAKATGGVLPGYTPGRDVHDFYSPTAGRLLLSGGEAVMRPEWTAAMGPAYVDAANKAARAGTLRDFLARTAPREGQAGGDGSMLATGGIWGPKPKEQRYAMGGTIASLGNPFPPMPTDLWKTLSEQMAAAMTPAMQEAVKNAEIEAAGGDALAWAKTQVGKPYIWGGVGPAGYDCSGFMSAVLNVLNGRPPHSRVGTTASFPWGGFQPGIGGRFSIGAFKGDPGHMAGTLGGTNVESSGSVGVRVGGGARGADNGMFTIRAHVASGGILPHFDQGGLASGRGLMVKDVIHPERILDARTTAAFEQLVPLLGSMPDRVRLGSQPVVTGAGGGRGDVAGVVAALQAQTSRMAAEIRAVAAEAATRPAVTVNDTSGNPVEAGRAAALAYRMAR